MYTPVEHNESQHKAPQQSEAERRRFDCMVIAVVCDVEFDCITIHCKMLLFTHPCIFSLWQRKMWFSAGLFKTIAAYVHKEREKRCLSAQEMNQFASMNHHSVSQNSSNICSGSWPFVARISLAVCCLTHAAQLRGGTSPSEHCASINPTRSWPGLTISLWVSIRTEKKNKKLIAPLKRVYYSVIKNTK